MQRKYGEATYVTADGPFAGGMVRANNVLCPDGIRRNAFPSADGIADTFYSVPAFVYARHEGKTVRTYGYVTIGRGTNEDGTEDYETEDVRFVPYTYRTHARAVCHPLPDAICKHCGTAVRNVREGYGSTFASVLSAHPSYVHEDGTYLCDVAGYRDGTNTAHAEVTATHVPYVRHTS